MVRVPTYASYMNLVNRTMQTKSMVNMYSYQATSGIKYADYAGYGMQASNIVNMEASLAVTQNFLDNNVILNTTVKAMSTVMENIEKSVSSFKSLLNNKISELSNLQNGKPITTEVSASVSELQAVAFAGISLISDALNTSVGGKYIFGAGSSAAPTQFKYGTLESFQKYYDGINVKYPTTSSANLSSREVSASKAGDLTITQGAEANEFIFSAAEGFTSVAVTAGAETTGAMTFSAVDNTLKAEVRGAFNSIGAGDTLMIDDVDGNKKAYIVKSVSADGKTITFADETPVTAGAAAPQTISTSFAVGTVVNFGGSSEVAPTMQVVGIQDDGSLIMRADESYFGTMPVTVPATDKWTMTSESYYVGGSATETFRISDNQSITLDVSANDSVFDKAFRAFGMIAQGNLIQTDVDGNVINADEVEALVNEAMSLLQSAVDNNGKATNGKNETLSLVIAKVSANYVTLDNVKGTLESVHKNLEDSVISIRDVDKTEAAAKLLEAQNSLQASYEVLNNVLNLSLLNYLN